MIRTKHLILLLTLSFVSVGMASCPHAQVKAIDDRLTQIDTELAALAAKSALTDDEKNRQSVLKTEQVGLLEKRKEIVEKAEKAGDRLFPFNQFGVCLAAHAQRNTPCNGIGRLVLR